VKRPLPPGTFSGFHGAQQETAKKTWFKYPDYFLTGDVGTIDENGYLTVYGRGDDVITLASDRKLYTKEVEDSIYERKEVAECAVIPFPSKERGTVPLAFVVLRGCPADEQEMELAKP
jgi:propionyl-CoA synthetase